jgi:nucleoside-diphosphate-sugar epimerase
MTDVAGRRVMVVGGAGFLGANLVRALLHAEASVHVLVRPAADLWRLHEVRGSIRMHHADVRDLDSVKATFRAAEPELVVDLARVGGSVPSPPPADLVAANVLGPVHVQIAATEVGCVRVVHLGSSQEYGPSTAPMRESDPPAPSTFYGVTKAAGTMLCLEMAREGGSPVVVLRPFSAYGPWEPPSRLISRSMLAAFRGEPLPLTVPGLRRDWVYAEDVVDACLRALVARGVEGAIINVGTGTEWTNEEVVRAVEKVCGRRIETVDGGEAPRPADAGHWVADPTLASRMLRWRPRHVLSTGIAEHLRWLTAHTVPSGPAAP